MTITATTPPPDQSAFPDNGSWLAAHDQWAAEQAALLRARCETVGHLTMVRWWFSRGIRDVAQVPLHRHCGRCGVVEPVILWEA